MEIRAVCLENFPKKDGGYMLDSVAAMKRVAFLPETDRKACETEIKSVCERKLTFSYQFCMFVKMDCGHWELLQLPYIKPENIGDMLKGRCTRCVSEMKPFPKPRRSEWRYI